EHRGNISPNVMTGIRDGLGHETAINYDLLTDSDRYTRIEVGNSESRELAEVCIDRPAGPGATEEYCYTPVEYRLDTTDFYAALNNPFSTLPGGNDSLGATTSPVLELYAPMPVVIDVIRTSPE